ncbi:hypothetical protein BDD12DRAFT_263189 [Trichophaea hybrida]|nr:hypothetical protein BDD12DRAFT_263189 [Trichophaea hybrida]
MQQINVEDGRMGRRKEGSKEERRLTSFFHRCLQKRAFSEKRAKQAPKHSPAHPHQHRHLHLLFTHLGSETEGFRSCLGFQLAARTVSRTTSHQQSNKFSRTAFFHSTLLQSLSLPHIPSITYQQTRSVAKESACFHIFRIVYTGEPALHSAHHTRQRYLTIHIHSAVVRRCTRKPPRTQKLDTQSAI